MTAWGREDTLYTRSLSQGSPRYWLAPSLPPGGWRTVVFPHPEGSRSQCGAAQGSWAENGLYPEPHDGSSGSFPSGLPTWPWKEWEMVSRARGEGAQSRNQPLGVYSFSWSSLDKHRDQRGRGESEGREATFSRPGARLAALLLLIKKNLRPELPSSYFTDEETGSESLTLHDFYTQQAADKAGFQPQLVWFQSASSFHNNKGAPDPQPRFHLPVGRSGWHHSGCCGGITAHTCVPDKVFSHFPVKCARIST